MPRDKQGVIWVHANNEGVNMNTLIELKLTVFHLMAASAVKHKELTGAQIAAFHVPSSVMDKLKKSKGWVQSVTPSAGYIGEFAFFEKQGPGIYMFEVGCTHPYEVLS